MFPAGGTVWLVAGEDGDRWLGLDCWCHWMRLFAASAGSCFSLDTPDDTGCMNVERIPHRKQAKTYNVPGHAHFLTFSCYCRLPLRTNDLWRAWMAEAVRAACAEQDVALWAYVFMPEHVHLLVKPRRTVYDLSAFRGQLKVSASKRILSSLKEQDAPLLKKLRVKERPGKVCLRFWQEVPPADKIVFGEFVLKSTWTENCSICFSKD